MLPAPLSSGFAPGDRVSVRAAYHSAPDLRSNGGTYVPDGCEGTAYVVRPSTDGHLFLARDARDAAIGEWDFELPAERCAKAVRS